MTMVKKPKLKKGEHGYINYKKKKQLFMTFIYVLIGVMIFIAGLLLNKFETKNIFTVIAILMVIPAAKRFVNFVVFFPYRSIDLKLYEKAFSIKQEEDFFYTDVVLTSPEKIMFLAFMTVAGSQVICLLGNEKQNAAYMKGYLEDGIKKRGLSYKLHILKKPEEFINKYKKADRAANNSEAQKELVAFLSSLVVE